MMLRALRAVALVVLLSGGVLAPPAAAADAGAFKTEIDDYLHRMLTDSNGLLSWDGADAIDVKDEGDGAVAVITKGHLTLRKSLDENKPLTSITLNRLEVHRKPVGADGKLVEYDITLPSRVEAVTADGAEVTLTLDGGKTMEIVEGEYRHRREMGLDIAGGRVEVAGKPGEGHFGPVSGHWKLTSDDKGGWTTPAKFAINGIGVLVPDAKLAASIDRIVYDGSAAGASIAELDAFSDLSAQAREDIQHNPDRAAAEYFKILTKMFSVFTGSQGELAIEGVTAQRPGGEVLATLAKASLGGKSELAGTDTISFRMTLRHDGLTIAPSLVAAAQVPQRAAMEFGLENIGGSVLGQIAEAAAKVGPDATASDRQTAMAQIFAAALRLQPTFRIYDASVDFRDVHIDATGEAKRAPPPPFGYASGAEINVRNFDALSAILVSPDARAELPLVKFLGEPRSGADGAATLKYRLTSATGQPFKVNGNDLSEWFAGNAHPAADQPRVLRLADPPISGDDVRAVQKALGKDRIKPLTDGVYDTATALAVMRFQSEHALNINGVVDDAMREKLGLAAPAPKNEKPAPKN